MYSASQFYVQQDIMCYRRLVQVFCAFRTLERLVLWEHVSWAIAIEGHDRTRVMGVLACGPFVIDTSAKRQRTLWDTPRGRKSTETSTQRSRGLGSGARNARCIVLFPSTVGRERVLGSMHDMQCDASGLYAHAEPDVTGEVAEHNTQLHLLPKPILCARPRRFSIAITWVITRGRARTPSVPPVHWRPPTGPGRVSQAFASGWHSLCTSGCHRKDRRVARWISTGCSHSIWLPHDMLRHVILRRLCSWASCHPRKRRAEQDVVSRVPLKTVHWVLFVASFVPYKSELWHCCGWQRDPTRARMILRDDVPFSCAARCGSRRPPLNFLRVLPTRAHIEQVNCASVDQKCNVAMKTLGVA